jgi:hypothetical protein
MSNRRFGGTYRLHLEGRRIRGARNQRYKQSDWRYIPPETSVDFQRTTRRIFQKIGLFITTAVRTLGYINNLFVRLF